MYNGDYKYAMQMRAEEIAEEEYGMDFYDLPEHIQTKVFREAEEGHFDDMAHRADMMRDSLRDG